MHGIKMIAVRAYLNMLTRHRLGYLGTRHWLERGGGADSTTNLRTEGHREVDEAAFERPHGDDSMARLQFVLEGSRFRSRSGERSK